VGIGKQAHHGSRTKKVRPSGCINGLYKSDIFLLLVGRAAQVHITGVRSPVLISDCSPVVDLSDKSLRTTSCQKYFLTSKSAVFIKHIPIYIGAYYTHLLPSTPSI